MKIFENPWFSLFIALLIIGSCFIAYQILQTLGASSKEATAVIIAALLTLPITFLSITIPLNRTFAGKKEDEEKELEKAYIGAGIIIAPELLSNFQLLEDLKDSIQKEYDIKEDIKNKISPKDLKTIVRMTAVREVANEINLSLADKYYLTAIASGILIKMQDEGFTNDLQQAYISIEECKAKLRQIAVHFQMIINPPLGVPDAPAVAERMLKENAPIEINVAIEQLDNTIKKIKKAIDSLNRVLKPYKRQFLIEKRRKVKRY